MYSAIEMQTDTLEVIPPNPYAQITTPSQVVTSSSDSLIFGLNFNSNFQDFSIDLESSNVFRPGFISSFSMLAKNMGNSEGISSIEVELPDFLDFEQSIPMPSQFDGNILIWENITLPRLESLNFSISVTTSSSVSINTPIEIKSTILPISGENNTNNNEAILNDWVVETFIPNTMSVSEDRLNTQQITDRTPLEYSIRFQNIGNGKAGFIHVFDTLDAHLDFSSFEILNHSHPMTYTINKSGEIDFFFENINLIDANSNEEESYGFVKYKVVPKENLQPGNVIYNCASICFGYSGSTQTNKVKTVIQVPSSTKNQIKSYSFKISPNPSFELAYLEFDEKIKDSEITIVKLNGKIVWSKKVDNLENLKLPEMAEGTYYICLLYTSPSPRDATLSRMPSSA